MPDEIDHDAATNRLLVGGGYIEPVPRAVWDYEVSGVRVVRQWFSYRKADRTRPLIGDRRPPSKLNDIRPKAWPPGYTADLLDLLNVLGRLVDLEPRQADLLARICDGPTIDRARLEGVGAFAVPAGWDKKLGGRPHVADGGWQPSLAFD